MSNSIDLTDDGFTSVTVRGPDGSAATVALDLFEANNAYVSICEEHADAIEQANAWVDWLAGRGFPRLSHAAAYKLAASVMEQVDQLKKTLGLTSPTAGSPASTGSTPPPDSPLPAPSGT